MKRIAAFLCLMLLTAVTVAAGPFSGSHAAAAGPNLVANPGVETASGTLPANWTSNSWGTNNATFTYDTTGGHTGRSVTAKVTTYTSGDAKWSFTPVTVVPGHVYTFSSWYKSTAVTGIDAVITTTTGTTSYQWIGNPAVSAAWKQQTYSFTAPANASKVTFYHYLDSAGTLSVDDYSLTDNAGGTTPVPPTVSLTAPAANATVSATQAVNANASDADGIASVQFKVDGNNIGAADTTAPYSVSWDSKTVANGTHSLTAVATDTTGASTTSAAVSVNVQNAAAPTAPVVSLTAPAANATVAATQTISANASDDQGIASVQFKVDNVNVGAADTTAPYSVSWDTKTVANGNHSLTAVATDTTGASTTSTAVSVNVQNPVPPTVSLTAPANNATVSATQAVSANASGTPAVTSVQFKLDGNNLGAADTTAPYTINWDTKTAADGAHKLTAVATSTAGSATSAEVNVTVSNPVTPPTANNLIANPSVETANGTVPASWTGDGWGTNTRSLTYETNGQDGSRSVKSQITAYTNGDAKWYFNPVVVTPGQAYNYSEYYKSNVDTEVDAMVTLTDGTVQYYWLGNVAASSANWTKLNLQFTAPANAATVTVFHVLSKVGYLQSDNFSFNKYTPAQFSRALVTLTYDDSWRSIYTNGLPALKKYGLVSTQYMNSTPTIDGYPDYMTYAMIKEFIANGHELGWHTRNHSDVTKLTATQLNTQLTIPPAYLTGIGQTASIFKHFATPFGAYNTTSVNAIMAKYQSHRSTDVGYNSKDNLDVRNIKVQNITNTTTPADVQAWVNQAIATKTWLVIVYHEVDTVAEDPTYAVTPANHDAELNIIKQSGVTVKTMDAALAELKPQL